MFNFKNEFDYLTDGEVDLKILKKVDEKDTINKAPTYAYGIYLHNQSNLIGRIDLRVGDLSNDNILMGGNVGYCIDNKYKGHNYAFKACLLLEQVAISHDMKELTIACSPNNEKSRKIIENLGYDYCDTIEVEKGTGAYVLGYRLRSLYKKDLAKKIVRRR